MVAVRAYREPLAVSNRTCNDFRFLDFIFPAATCFLGRFCELAHILLVNNDAELSL